MARRTAAPPWARAAPCRAICGAVASRSFACKNCTSRPEGSLKERREKVRYDMSSFVSCGVEKCENMGGKIRVKCRSRGRSLSLSLSINWGPLEPPKMWEDSNEGSPRSSALLRWVAYFDTKFSTFGTLSFCNISCENQDLESNLLPMAGPEAGACRVLGLSLPPHFTDEGGREGEREGEAEADGDRISGSGPFALAACWEIGQCAACRRPPAVPSPSC